MKHTVSHDLGQERAKKVTESALTTYAEKFAKYSPKTTWTSPSRAQISFSVKGMSLTGARRGQRQEHRARARRAVPAQAVPGPSLSVIEGEIKDWLAKEKANG